MQYSCHNCEQIFAGLGPIAAALVILFILAILAAIIIIKAVVYCQIFHKTGWHWALGLLMLVPIACVIMLFVLAFAKWPIERQLQQLRHSQGEKST